MSVKPTLSTLLTIAALLAAIVSLWVTLMTTSNQKQMNLRLLAVEGDVRDILIQATNSTAPTVSTTNESLALEQATSNLTAQIEALRQEFHATPAPTPNPEVAPISSPGANMRYYLIRPGDTMTSIAADQDVPLDVLESANPNIDPDDLDVGQRIKIPLHPATE